MPRALFLTSQFFSYAGAEMTVFELAIELMRRGWTCTVKASVVGAPLGYAGFSKGMDVEKLTEPVDPRNFDLIWCLHGTIANVDLSNLFDGSPRPYIVSAHLSPFVPLERLVHPYTNEIADLVVVNSAETAESLPVWLHTEVVINRNAAPCPFFRARLHRTEIKRVLSITNHLPGELSHVLLNFERNLNIEVTRIGYGGEFRQVYPDDILNADLVITIGKSVQYAIASRTPVYLYDHFGGDGWITGENLDTLARYNFSGRPSRRRLTSSDISAEITDGYGHAIDAMTKLDDQTLRAFSLDAFVDDLLSKVAAPRPSRPTPSLDPRVSETATAYVSLLQALKTSKYNLPYSNIWSHPSLDLYFGQG